MANRLYNKQVSPKKYMVGGRVKRDKRLSPAGMGPMKAKKIRIQKEKMADKFRLKEKKLRGSNND